ncbi:hypothetical protein CFIO01_13244 [Colletotrichum fioriniae PJ7]|uniref:Uncharacterized protein n=1 Tax=Colletotrichum fioriniae PJ7 TaxID=1445577 RepID=A0A010RTR8_9PEZI|nr:hypothetical protein CFIO01_13244 [Colletotrichum fioriniae PJ7]
METTGFPNYGHYSTTSHTTTTTTTATITMTTTSRNRPGHHPLSFYSEQTADRPSSTLMTVRSLHRRGPPLCRAVRILKITRPASDRQRSIILDVQDMDTAGPNTTKNESNQCPYDVVDTVCEGE